MQLSFLRARLRFYSPSKGGCYAMPIGDGFAPYIRASSLKHDLAIRVYGLPIDGGFDTDYDVELELSYYPRVDYSDLKLDEQFSLILGVKTVGTGVILSEIFRKEIGSIQQS